MLTGDERERSSRSEGKAVEASRSPQSQALCMTWVLTFGRKAGPNKAKILKLSLLDRSGITIAKRGDRMSLVAWNTDHWSAAFWEPAFLCC